MVLFGSSQDRQWLQQCTVLPGKAEMLLPSGSQAWLQSCCRNRNGARGSRRKGLNHTESLGFSWPALGMAQAALHCGQGGRRGSQEDAASSHPGQRKTHRRELEAEPQIPLAGRCGSAVRCWLQGAAVLWEESGVLVPYPRAETWSCPAYVEALPGPGSPRVTWPAPAMPGWGPGETRPTFHHAAEEARPPRHKQRRSGPADAGAGGRCGRMLGGMYEGVHGETEGCAEGCG